MNVLVVSPVCPVGRDSGSKIRVFHSIKSLSVGHRVHCLSVGQSALNGCDLSDIYAEKVTGEAVGGPKGLAATCWHSMAYRMTYRSAKFYNIEFINRLEKAVREYNVDLLWVHFLNMMTYVREASLTAPLEGIPIVLDQHNDVEMVWQRHMERGSLFERLYAKWNICQIRNLRSWALPRCDVVLSVSEREAQSTRTRVEGDTPVWVAPNGVSLDRVRFSTDPDPGKTRLLFVGSMDVKMNIDAVMWFVQDILPVIRSSVPSVELQIVGRNPAPDILALDQESGIEVTGRVEQVRDFYKGAAVAVVPLRMGGGTKLKVPEAMAARVPVVATSVGVQGLDVMDGEHLRIADEVREFASATIELLSQREEANKLAEAAYERVKEKYSWSSIYGDVVGKIEKSIGN